MIISENMSKWVSEFRKTFFNFCKKVPLILSFNLTTTSITLFEQKYNSENTNLLYTFQLDFTKSVQSNIAEIKNWLLKNKYPVMIKQNITYKKFTPDELKEMINDGLKLDDVLKKEKIIEQIRMRIEKIIIQRNEFHIRNLETNNIYAYYLEMPSILFLKKLEQTLKPVEAWEFFIEKAKLLYQIDEDKKYA